MIGANARLLLIASALLSTTVTMAHGWAEAPAAPGHRSGGPGRAVTIASRVALPLLAAPQDRASAGEPHLWSRSLEDPPLPDVAGKWTGSWSGLGVMSRRTSTAQAEFIQAGRWGWGKITLADTLAADVPSIVSYRGALGVPVLFDVFQSAVLVKHEAGGSHLTAVFRIEGDRMIGMLRGHGTLIVLARQR
jgi:hypothetical protein